MGFGCRPAARGCGDASSGYAPAVHSNPSRDRRDILHLAGRRRLSPAVRDGVPALLPPQDLAGRCGWEAFFAALERSALWVWEEGDGTVRLAPRSQEGGRAGAAKR